MFNGMKQTVQAILEDESGQDLMEYALVAGLIALGGVVAMTSLSGKIGTAFNNIGNSLSKAIT